MESSTLMRPVSDPRAPETKPAEKIKTEIFDDVKKEHSDITERTTITLTSSHSPFSDFQSKNEYYPDDLICKESAHSSKTGSMKISSDDKIIVIQYNDYSKNDNLKRRDNSKFRELLKELRKIKSELALCRSYTRENTEKLTSDLAKLKENHSANESRLRAKLISASRDIAEIKKDKEFILNLLRSTGWDLKSFSMKGLLTLKNLQKKAQMIEKVSKDTQTENTDCEDANLTPSKVPEITQEKKKSSGKKRSKKVDKGIVEGLLYLIDANKEKEENTQELKSLIMTKSPEKITHDLIYNNLYEAKTRQKNVDYKKLIKPMVESNSNEDKVEGKRTRGKKSAKYEQIHRHRIRPWSQHHQYYISRV
eukprot:TRINITY_DN6486_c0_g2_i1.p3 TRINITY_DN6486_c0_g2~~TRINITY_DN6486_c0_g2_i1.p3  ORF type:complete len:365 (-),score=32.15 TRINITY_DN6486_c0_g2_i1:1517-2611(-)